MKPLLLIFIFCCLITCSPERDLFAVEKPFVLIEVKKVYKSGDYIWSMKWVNTDSLKIIIFRKTLPEEQPGHINYWPVILSNWEK